MHEYLLTSASRLSDEEPLARVKTLAGGERSSTVELVAHLAELETRKVCLGTGRSLYLYCTQTLHLSEHAAYTRIGAARAAKQFPLILDLLADGSVNVTTVTLLAPRLTVENHRALLREVTHRTKDEVKEIVRRLDPQPDAKTIIRKLSAPVPVPVAVVNQPPGAPPAGGQPPVATPAAAALVLRSPNPGPSVEPLAPGRYRLQITMGKETHEALRRLQDLPARETSGDAAIIIDRALRLLLTEVEKKKLGLTSKSKRCRPPKESSRRIPAAVRRVVWRRDEKRCAFVGSEGRCQERKYLEWHHVVPRGHQGPATVDNISLRCRAHNLYEGELVFGVFDPMVTRETGSAYGDRELGLDRVRKATPRPSGAAHSSMTTRQRDDGLTRSVPGGSASRRTSRCSARTRPSGRSPRRAREASPSPACRCRRA